MFIIYDETEKVNRKEMTYDNFIRICNLGYIFFSYL